MRERNLLFNSLIFTVFLPVVFITYWILPPRRRNLFLLLASYYFYFSYHPWFVLLLLGTSLVDYYCARLMPQMPKRKKLLLAISVISNLGILVAFKYSAFFYNSIYGGFQLLTRNQFNPVEDLIIPAGLSFYTFQSLSYTIDVYRGKYKPDDTLYEFMLYVSFFPHMVAGPVVRYSSLMPQLKIRQYLKEVEWGPAARLLIWGYFKKLVIADNLNLIVTPVFSAPSGFEGSEILLAGFLFVIQVYCDFSGYSDIATGVAKLFRIDLSLNWRRPLLSRSLREFWTRNHISITTWFRDYLYISLGGNRVSYNRWLLNIFLVFLISGLWHGASFTFVIWGGMHGLVYLAEILGSRRFPRVRIPALLGWLYLISFHTLSLLAFRSHNVGDLMMIYSKIFSSGLFSPVTTLFSLHDRFFYLMTLSFIILLFLKELQEEFNFAGNARSYSLLRTTFYLSGVILIFIFGNFSANTFIYFQF